MRPPRQVNKFERQAGPFNLPSRWDRWEPLAEVIATVILALPTLGDSLERLPICALGRRAIHQVQPGWCAADRIRRAHQHQPGKSPKSISAYSPTGSTPLQWTTSRWLISIRTASARSSQWLLMPGGLPTPKTIRRRRNPRFPCLSIQSAKAQEADRLEQGASNTFAEGRRKTQNSDNYILNTVILASVLFLAGLQTRIKSVPARMLIIILSLIILTYGLFNIATYPIQ